MNQFGDAVAGAEDPRSDAETVYAAVAELLASAPITGVSAALEILSRGPRIKPSFGLLIDPENAVFRRWEQRVAAGRALVNSSAGRRVFAELYDELTESHEFAIDVLGYATPSEAFSAAERAALLSLITSECGT